MRITEKELRERGIFRDVDDIVAEAREMVHYVLEELPVGRVSHPEREFSRDEVAALEEGGIDVTRPVRRDGKLAVAVAKHGRMLAMALTVFEAAEILGVTEPRVRQRLKEGTLYELEVTGNERRLPRFQFWEEGEVPGMGKVLKEVDRRIHPVALENFFTYPNPDFYLDEEEQEPISPREWLLSGGSPEAVIPLAREL